MPPHFYFDPNWQMYDPLCNPYWGYYYNYIQGFDPSYFGCPPQAINNPYFYGYPPAIPPHVYFNMQRQMYSRERDSTRSESVESVPRIVVTPTNEASQYSSDSYFAPNSCNESSDDTADEEIKNKNLLRVIKQDSNSDDDSSSDEKMLPLKFDNCTRSLKSVPSVSNINVYVNEDEDSNESDNVLKQQFQDDEEKSCESMMDDDTTELGDGEELSEDTEIIVDEHFPHQLSIIYEENESQIKSRRSSIISSCSTMSDCSTTLMEEDNLAVDIECEDGDFQSDGEDDANSVTVRLPLKFSFSRSKDNLVNTTLTVGESEFSDHSSGTSNSRSRSSFREMSEKKSQSPASLQNQLSKSDSIPEVSVTFKLQSKGKTPDRSLSTPSTPSTPPQVLIRNTSIESDSDISVSFSLPRKSKAASEEKQMELLLVPETSNEEKTETSDNSTENKKFIDTDLNTSIDAFEDIKKGMEEITFSLCSRICALKQNSLTLQNNNDSCRSSSTSQIDDIETDTECDWSWNCKTKENDVKNSLEEDKESSYAERATNAAILQENNVSDSSMSDSEEDESFTGSESEEDPVKVTKKTETLETEKDGDVDFWQTISSANKSFEVKDVSEDLKEKSCVWKDTNEGFNWLDDAVSDVENNNDSKDTVQVISISEKGHIEHYIEPTNDESEYEETDQEDYSDEIQEPVRAPTPPKAIVFIEPKQLTHIVPPVESESEYETDSEVEEMDELPKTTAPQTAHPNTSIKPIGAHESEGESSDDESEEDNHSEEHEKTLKAPDINVSMDITNKNVAREITEDENESESSSEEESDEVFESPKHSLNLQTEPHSNEIKRCESGVLPLLKSCKSTDIVYPRLLTTYNSLGSNMTSESGISIVTENNDDSESEYEEDSFEGPAPSTNNIDSNQINEGLTTEILNDGDETDEIKINIKNKISMFEKNQSVAMLSDNDKSKVPRVSAKYSFKYREMSEPPKESSAKCFRNIARAVSEAKDLIRSKPLIDLMNERRSMPPADVEERKSVRDRISSFEGEERRESFKKYGYSKVRRNETPLMSPFGRSVDESEEDSGVTSDIGKQVSENETDSENFPELRKLSRYQRANTHSRLYKLLHGDDSDGEDEDQEEVLVKIEEPPRKPKKIVHNVSVTRRNNPNAAFEAESMEERRQRLCLPLSHQSSSGADSMSSSATPSPTPGLINEKLVNELVQSLLLQKKGKMFKNLPIEKLHAAAVKILQEDMDSNGTISSTDESLAAFSTVDSTPALTPQEFRNHSSYSEYYDSWNNQAEPEYVSPSKAFKSLQEQQIQISGSKKLWNVRCPRILSSKSVNKDLKRLSEVRESESPEPYSNSLPLSRRSMSTEPMSEENNISKGVQERRISRICNT